jgi:hypothetical protein
MHPGRSGFPVGLLLRDFFRSISANGATPRLGNN